MELLGRFSNLAVVSGLLFLGCDRAVDTGSSEKSGKNPAELQKEYADRVLRMKGEIPDRSLLASKVLELKSKYSILDGESPITIPEIVPSGDAPEGLAKTAVNGTLVKNFQTYMRQTYTGSFGVASLGGYVTVTATAIGTADPFLVVFRDVACNGACPWFNKEVYGWNDDGGGGLSSKVTLNTHPIGTYRFIVFSANGTAGIGNVNISIYHSYSGSTTTINNVPARGYGAVHNNIAPSPCTDRFRAQSDIYTTAGDFWFTLNAHYNTATLRPRGGTPYSDWIQDESAANIYPNFVLGAVDPGHAEPLGYISQYDICN
jgi:hypothetical protein